MIKMMAKIYQTSLTHIQKSLNHSSLIKVTSIFWNNASIEEKTIYKKLFKRVKNYIFKNNLTRIEQLLSCCW
uniref:Uncharacterized protein n=1 Tax=Rhizophagus irregularis (strain DAOM 181602 / DAOM 197198 / MUCL 43194) TaxID=747089 RepID=U9U9P5_RHIID